MGRTLTFSWEHGREPIEALVRITDSGEVTCAFRRDGGAWGVPYVPETDSGYEEPTIYTFTVSFGLIPETYAFTDEAKAETAWRKQVDELLEAGELYNDIDSGDELTAEQAYGESFLFDGNKYELRKEW